ncbi:MAG: hypothetical protein ABSH40_19845, partial [Bryobacteraceae bacterium]
AAVAAAAAWALKLAIGTRHPMVYGASILCLYGVVYFGATYLFRVEECAGMLRRITRRVTPSSP